MNAPQLLWNVNTRRGIGMKTVGIERSAPRRDRDTIR